MGFLSSEVPQDQIEQRGAEFSNFMKQRVGLVNRKLDEFFNEENSEHYFKRVLERSGYEFDTDALVEGVIKPVKYLVELGGKRVRALMTMLSMEALGVDSANYVEFAIIPETIHNGTLVHDDVQDNSDMRRGAKALHKVYGLDMALNVGDILYFITMPMLDVSRKIDDGTKRRISSEYMKRMLGLGVGQATDIVWHRQMLDVFSITEDQYLRVVFDKTGALLGFAAKLGALIAKADDDTVSSFGKLGNAIGVSFQIQDDILNIGGGKVAENKGGAGEDITEGKVTLLVVHALHSLPESKAKRLASILKEHTKDKGKIGEAIALIEESGATDYARKRSAAIISEAWDGLRKRLPDGKEKAYIAAMLDMLLSRES